MNTEEPTSSSPMTCPLCATSVPLEDQTCPNCAADLTEYAQVFYYPDDLFNQGLVDLGRERWSEASLAFSRVMQHRPRDVQALRAWAYAASQDGAYAQARELYDQALKIEPSEQLTAILAELAADLRTSLDRLDTYLAEGPGETAA